MGPNPTHSSVHHSLWFPFSAYIWLIGLGAPFQLGILIRESTVTQLVVVCTLGSLGATNPNSSDGKSVRVFAKTISRDSWYEDERNCVLGTRSVLSVRKSLYNILWLCNVFSHSDSIHSWYAWRECDLTPMHSSVCHTAESECVWLIALWALFQLRFSNRGNAVMQRTT